MELAKLLDAFVRKFWLILILAILGGGIAFIYNELTAVTMYQAQASLYIMNKSDDSLISGGLTYQDLIMSKQLVQDYGEIIRSRKVLAPVIKTLDIKGFTENEMQGFIDVSLEENSNIMIVSAYWTDPETAAAIVNSVSKNFTSKIKEMTGTDSVGIIDEAIAPKSSIPTNRSKTISIGLLIGFVIAISTIYILVLFDTTIRDASDIERGMGLKVIGIIPEHNIR